MKITVPIYLVKQLDKQILRLEDTIRRRAQHLRELKELRSKLEPNSDQRYKRNMKGKDDGEK